MTTQYVVKNQSRTTEPTPYEIKLAGAIEDVFGTGRHDLASLVEGLNERGIYAPGGVPWTEMSFQAEIKKLGA